ncbi:MAG: PrsW family intramembrane metalloprotease [Anaerolineaceae bacterium]|nr:PrsW family intramembrane metalloprotease [Anaerolineaceae bacterium]
MSLLPAAKPSRFLTISQLIVSILGILNSVFVLISLVFLLQSPSADSFLGDQKSQLLNMIWVFLAILLLTIPSLVASIRALSSSPASNPQRGRLLFASVALLLLFPLVWLSSQPASPISGSALAMVNIFSILIPIWWLLELGHFQLVTGPRKRQWGLVVFGFYISLPVTIILEFIFILVAALLGWMWLVQQPEAAPLLALLGSETSLDPTMLQQLSEVLLPLLQRPQIVAVLFAIIGLFIPIIEELLKPLGLWVLNNRHLSPAEGFSAGMICGAAFALLESLLSLSAALPSDWLYTVVGRAGTGLLHVFTAGLNGWALAATWKDGKYLRAGLTYILTVALHGTWNVFAVLMGMKMVSAELPWFTLPSIASGAVWVLSTLAALILLALILFNRYLRTQSQSPSTPPPLPTYEAPGMG